MTVSSISKQASLSHLQYDCILLAILHVEGLSIQGILKSLISDFLLVSLSVINKISMDINMRMLFDNRKKINSLFTSVLEFISTN